MDYLLPAGSLQNGPTIEAIIDMDWDLVSFLKYQEYDSPLDVVMGRAITITESLDDAQALSCVDYESGLAFEWYQACARYIRSPKARKFSLL